MATEVCVPYGKREMVAQIPDGIPVQIIDPPVAPVADTIENFLQQAMEHPIGTPKLEEMVKSTDTVAIVVNDHTRPVPNVEILDQISSRLEIAGVPDRNVCLVVATGSHRASTPEEIEKMYGPLYSKRYRLVMHNYRDDDNLEYIGKTPDFDLPVYVNKAVTQASFVILAGMIAPHHAAGYSGGRKSIMPGVAGFASLHVHHSFPIKPLEPTIGKMSNNNFHRAALQAALLTNSKFIVNALQDAHKQFIGFVAGDLVKAHAAGVELARLHCEVHIDQPADIVIASPGGAPRDLDLYQSQKALSVAEMLGRRGCSYILVAECSDGSGHKTFEEWMEAAKTPEEVMQRFTEVGFMGGNTKAYNFARALTKGRVIVVTNKMSKKKLNGMMLEWAPDLQTALNMSMLGKKPNKVMVIPRASNMVPILDHAD